ncbi:DUF1816 domain-containing protein [filamentous cyanobacterium LEGE 11480]|uniref:DUF1816 domain-containing protein n=1 Tax=Romeriopsis navalis LEGE 11480 TaxID=2777977 RepID=A0A928VKD9_9CYAN|nr:DUF1816 domain-containing protein [Romeriopsis navalis]MBE9028150.1 DUF1816 domain-containing protein [Romeriopsis navalis LEGE 11480]
MKDILTGSLNAFGLAWWVEITTENPTCLYYFGPFNNAATAEIHKPGYIEDLNREGAQKIQVVVKRCKPKELTVFDETETPIPTIIKNVA